MRLAIFDLDGTLTRRDSHVRLMAHLLLHGRAGRAGRRALAASAVRHVIGRASNTELKEAAVAALAGLSVEALDALFRDFCRWEVLPDLRAGAADFLDAHRALGYRTMLLSASLQGVVDGVRAALGADFGFGTPLEISAGRATGRLGGPALHGRAKVRLLLDFAAANGVDLARSVGYGDSGADRHFLGLVGRPVAVRPDAWLRVHAWRNGWPIIRRLELPPPACRIGAGGGDSKGNGS